jgi:uncharacterized protein (TIGR02099 family)
MKRFLRRVINLLAYTAAGLVIVLAILVGLFRLFLPRLPEYQEDIKAWANAAIGMQVEFSGMNARWRLSGPELNFYSAALTLPDAEESLLEAAEVTVGVGLVRLLFDRRLVVDRILVRDTSIQVEKTQAGGFFVQGLSLDDLAALVPVSNESSDVVVIGQDIAVNYRDPEGQRLLSFEIALVEASRDDEELALEASLNLEEGFGSRLDVSAQQRVLSDLEDPVWQLYVEGRALGLARWSRFAPAPLAPVTSGSGDVSLWVEVRNQTIDKATANFAVDDLSIEGADRAAPFDVEGRLEFSRAANGFLFAAENFRMRTVDLDWPRSSIQMQVDLGNDEAIEVINANATFVRLDDIAYISSWLPTDVRELYNSYRPTGEISELRFGLSTQAADDRRFDVTATLKDAGINVIDPWPGVRNFSGNVRADSTGGRVEFASGNLRVEIPNYVSDTLIFDDAIGTVIWRRSGANLTVLSDRLQLRNADFDSQSSLQVTVAGEDAAPVVDLQSTWSINDVASAKRFLPEPIIAPPLYSWLQDALVSGRMTEGSARLIGPLDKFPFDGGEGEFRIRATMEDAVMLYGKNWPAASIGSMDIRLDGMRLYSEKNTAFTAGNATSDAKVEIADLRDPVLTIDAFSTGTLGSIREYSRRSPIASVFGGKLDTVSVDGDASLDLKLALPLKERQDYDFTARVQVSDGSAVLDGFAPPLSEMNGMVVITRDQVSSESLFGRFLGEPMTIDLHRIADATSAYSIVAEARGAVTAEGLVNDLGAPIEGLVSGTTPMEATVRFPRAGLDEPPPVQIALRSDLDGFLIDLPAPLYKPKTQPYSLSMLIEFPESGHIASNGSLGDDLRWASDFRQVDGRWDFDRGALAFGGDYPDYPGSRGLHIQGQVDTLYFADWLAMSQDGSGEGRVGERIRSIDLGIDHLHILGQHFRDHRIIVDRGGNDWFVRAEGPQMDGVVTIPYDLNSSRPISLEMNTLVLPGNDEVVDESTTGIDPRSLPPVSVSASEFAFGERFVGAVAAEFLRTPDGLVASAMSAKDDSFWIEGTAGWVVDPLLAGSQQTYLSAKLVSQDISKTMERLNYDPGIVGSDMEIDIDVRWPGAPRADYLDVLDGEVAVRFGSGQLNEVEPGAGRVFGLMSVVALPRRLSLDFRDVFDKGFGFDEIRGTFNIDNGDAYTCDLSLKGPAADIVIVGRAGLASTDYHQTALVSANVGNTLPIVGTVVAGPQVGAALLIFSQIFKKPLQEMGQVYYAIDGSFDEPVVEAADGQHFEETSSMAGCLADPQ